MNIQLPPHVLAGLYKDALVITEEVSMPSKNEGQQVTKKMPVVAEEILPTAAKKWFLGDNGKRICIVVKDETAVFINDESLNLLSGILNACRLNLGDVAIVNYAQTPVDYAAMKKELLPQQCFLFNITARDVKLPFTVPYYQVQQFDGCSFLLSPSLQNMNGDSKEAKMEKSKLWLCLKKIFNV